MADARFALPGLRSDIDRALVRRMSPAVEEELVPLAPYIRASQLADCGRKHTLLAGGVTPTTPSPEGILMMVQGDWGEDGMVTLLADAGYAIRDRQRELNYFVNGEEVLRGHIDGLLGLDHGALGTTWSLWENKLMSAFRFKKLIQASVKDETPQYYTQTQVYMRLLRDAGEDIEDCTFTAVAKDPSAANMGNRGPRLDPIYIETIPFDLEFSDAALERAVHLRDVIRDGRLWPHERDPQKDWDCSERFCPVYAVCDPKNTRRSHR